MEGTGDQTLATSLDTLPDGRKKGPQHQKSFAAETAALTGASPDLTKLLYGPAA